MRAEEREASVAYAYAWWMTGDEAAATSALRAGLGAPEPAAEGNDGRLVALMTGVRRHLGDVRAMPASSEVALLRDGFGVPLQAAAHLSGVEGDTAGYALAQGRLEALLETVREPFAHADRLADLALGEPEALAHAGDCRSCGRALTLIERGRAELREVAPVSAPPGLIATLVAEAAPTEAPGEAAEAPAEAEAADPPVRVPSVDELEAMLRTEAPEAPAEPAEAAPEAPERAPDAGAQAAAAAPVEDAPAPPAPPARRRPAPRPPAPAPPARERIPMGAGRRGLLAVLAGAGVLTAGILLIVMFGARPAEQTPAADGPTQEPTASATAAPDASASPQPGATDSPFDPPGNGFAVDEVGLLRSGEETLAAQGVTVGSREALRLAVDYANASKGVQLRAVWRVDGKVYERLSAVVSARASRHVWGLSLSSAGLPTGQHRITVKAEGAVVGTVDFTVSAAT